MSDDTTYAFPNNKYASFPRDRGMTLRDYMAIRIAVALCSHERDSIAVNMGGPELLAKDAYIMADALIAESKK